MALTDKLTAIADAIRAKTGTTEKLTLAQMPAAIAAIQTGGGENPMDYANSLRGAFANTKGDNTDLVVSFGAKCNTPLNPEAVYTTFQNAEGYQSIKVTWEGAATTDGISLFNVIRRSIYSEDTLETFDLTGMQNSLYITNMNRCFENRLSLREILGEFDLTNCTTLGAIAARCYALETIRFKAGTIQLSLSFSDSPLLTDATIQNIIDGLADLTGGTAQTLTLHATVGAKLTDAQKSAASAKNWTISY